MNTHPHPRSAGLARAGLGALAITAASLLVETAPGQDLTFPLFMLGGPIATGAMLARSHKRWQTGAGAWALAALVWLILDWAINQEDVAFHAIVGAIFVALVALGAGLVRAGHWLLARTTHRAVI